MLLGRAAYQDGHFRQIVGNVRQGGGDGHHALLPEAEDGRFQPVPGGGQFQAVAVEQVGVYEQPLPEGPGGNGIYPAVALRQRGGFGQVQPGIGGVDFLNGHHPAENGRGIRVGGEEEQHVRLVACGKVIQHTGFPAFVAGGGGILNGIARLFLKGAEQLHIGVGGRVGPGKAAGGAQGQSVAKGAGGRKQRQQAADQADTALHASSSFRGISRRTTVRPRSSLRTSRVARPP